MVLQLPRVSVALNKTIQRRRAQRDALFPHAPGYVFDSAGGGWCQMPRTVPMIASLLDSIAGKDKPGKLYVTLWSYAFADGFVEIPDPARVALEAGYVTKRGERTFEERMRQLRDLEFIQAQPLGNREFGFVLLLDPHRAVMHLASQKPEAISPAWWSAFVARCTTIGINLTSPTPAPTVEVPAAAPTTTTGGTTP
jgi:hypothetical protein